MKRIKFFWWFIQDCIAFHDTREDIIENWQDMKTRYRLSKDLEMTRLLNEIKQQHENNIND